MLFMGEEWGADTPWQYFTNHEEAWLATAVRDGRRSEFAAYGWDVADVPDPEDPQTFIRSKLDWSQLAGEQHAGLLAWYRELIALRRARPELTDPRLDRVSVSYDEDARWLVVARGRLLIVARGRAAAGAAARAAGRHPGRLPAGRAARRHGRHDARGLAGGPGELTRDGLGCYR
jgi:maltooligosyltrehalose trehalohydrolase